MTYEGPHEEREGFHECLRVAQSVVREGVYHKELHVHRWAVHDYTPLVRVYASVRGVEYIVLRHNHLRRVYECECQCETEHGTEWETGHDLKVEMESVQYGLAHVSEHDFHHKSHHRVFVLVVREREQVEPVHTQVLQAHVSYRRTTTVIQFY